MHHTSKIVFSAKMNPLLTYITAFHGDECSNRGRPSHLGEESNIHRMSAFIERRYIDQRKIKFDIFRSSPRLQTPLSREVVKVFRTGSFPSTPFDFFKIHHGPGPLRRRLRLCIDDGVERGWLVGTLPEATWLFNIMAIRSDATGGSCPKRKITHSSDSDSTPSMDLISRLSSPSATVHLLQPCPLGYHT